IPGLRPSVSSRATNIHPRWCCSSSLSHSHSHCLPPLHCLLVARQCKVYIEKRFPVARDQANTPLSRDFYLRSRPGLQTFSPAGAGILRSHTHTHTVFLRSTVSSLRANVKCTSKKDSLWRATKPTRRYPGTSTFGLVPGYKHSAPLGLVFFALTLTLTLSSSAPLSPRCAPM